MKKKLWLWGSKGSQSSCSARLLLAPNSMKLAFSILKVSPGVLVMGIAYSSVLFVVPQFRYCFSLTV